MTTTAVPMVLDVQGRAFPLAYGAAFTRGEFPMLVPATPDGPVAQVVANPNDPTQLGLQNLTAQPWTALMPDGSQQQVDPGRSARLIDGVTLLMGGAQAQIRAAQAPIPAAFGQAQPPAIDWTQGQGQAFGQPQAPASGWTQQPAPAFGQPQAPPQPQWQPPQAQAGFATPAFEQPQAPTNGAWPPPAASPAGGWNMNVGANDSGTGKTAVLPPELQGNNYGACMLSVFWAVSHKTWIGLLALLPFVGLLMLLVTHGTGASALALWALGLGVLVWIITLFALWKKGNKWAWQNRRWDSIGQFQQVQQKWASTGKLVIYALIILRIILRVVLPSH